MTHEEILKKHTKQINYGWSYYYDDDQILKAMAEAVQNRDTWLEQERLRLVEIVSELWEQLSAKDKEISELKNKIHLLKIIR